MEWDAFIVLLDYHGWQVVAAFFDCCVRVLATNILHPPNQLTERILTLIKVRYPLVYKLGLSFVVVVQESLMLKPSLVSVAQFDLQFSEYKVFLSQLRYRLFCTNETKCHVLFFQELLSLS